MRTRTDPPALSKGWSWGVAMVAGETVVVVVAPTPTPAGSDGGVESVVVDGALGTDVEEPRCAGTVRTPLTPEPPPPIIATARTTAAAPTSALPAVTTRCR